MILINVKFAIRPERLDEWLPAARQYAKDVQSEPGNVYFEWYCGIDDPATFVAIECFRDADAGAAHMGTDHVKGFMALAPDLVAERPQIVYLDTPAMTGWNPMGEISPR